MHDPQLGEERIFHIAREIGNQETRSAYLDQICADDQPLRERVEALLQTHENEKTFLQSNNDIVETADHSAVTETEGQQIGRYKLLQKIGEGGFGVVFMAEQKHPMHRRVALKVIKPGMDSKAVVARFEAERQALAMMNHPNIARILDGGETDQGRPYFVMDLVKGVPITEFCDANQLTTDQRLELFKTVCHAVQHAHQKGIIHRDLKPSNILVTLNDGKPMAKIINFGVAKALHHDLTEKTYFTQFGQMIGTLQYMSPEQAEISAMDVDTRSDIYSLGVVLYELLTGSTPISGERLRSSGFGEIQRIIREEEALRPSKRLSTMGEKLAIVASKRGTDDRSLERKLRGDLDWIILKSLMKERQYRYQSANDFANDIQRHLASDPIQRQATTLYYIRKLYERNKVLVSSAAVVLLSLVTGLALAISGFVDAANSRDEYQQIVKELSDVLAERAIDQTFQGEYKLAIEAIDRAESAKAPLDLTDTLRGMAVFVDGENDKAIEHLKTVSQERPKSIIARAALSWVYNHTQQHGKHEVVQHELREIAGSTSSRSEYEEFFLVLENFVDGDEASLLRSEEQITNIIDQHRYWGVAYVLRARIRNELAMVQREFDKFEGGIADIEQARQLLGDIEFVMSTATAIYVCAYELAADKGDARAAQWWTKAEAYASTFTTQSKNALGIGMAAIFHLRYGDDILWKKLRDELVGRSEEGTIAWTATEGYAISEGQEKEWRSDITNHHKQIALCYCLLFGPGRDKSDEEDAKEIIWNMISRDPPLAFYTIAIDIARMTGDKKLLAEIIRRAKDSGTMDEDHRLYRQCLEFHEGTWTEEEFRELSEPFALDSSDFYYAVAMKAWSDAVRTGDVKHWKKVKEYFEKTLGTGTVTWWTYSNAKALMDTVQERIDLGEQPAPEIDDHE